MLVSVLPGDVHFSAQFSAPLSKSENFRYQHKLMFNFFQATEILDCSDLHYKLLRIVMSTAIIACCHT
jgi:hypothetical protein